MCFCVQAGDSPPATLALTLSLSFLLSRQLCWAGFLWVPHWEEGSGGLSAQPNAPQSAPASEDELTLVCIAPLIPAPVCLPNSFTCLVPSAHSRTAQARGSSVLCVLSASLLATLSRSPLGSQTSPSGGNSSCLQPHWILNFPRTRALTHLQFIASLSLPLSRAQQILFSQ